MKLDYLKDGSDYCPLVRLYQFDSADARRLRQTFEALADGTIENVGLDAVGYIRISQPMNCTEVAVS